MCRKPRSGRVNGLSEGRLVGLEVRNHQAAMDSAFDLHTQKNSGEWPSGSMTRFAETAARLFLGSHFLPAHHPPINRVPRGNRTDVMRTIGLLTALGAQLLQPSASHEPQLSLDQILAKVADAASPQGKAKVKVLYQEADMTVAGVEQKSLIIRDVEHNRLYQRTGDG